MKGTYYKLIGKKALLLFGALLMLALTACGSSATSDGGSSSKSVKIGMVLSGTGPYAPLADSVKKGFDLYLSQHDNKLGGKEATVKADDTQGDPKKALTSYRKLVQSDKVNILVGPISSSVAYALRDKVDKDKVLLIDPNAAADDLSWSKKSEYVYRMSFSNWQNGYAAADYIANNVGKKAIAIAPDYAAGKEVVRSFKSAFEAAGGTVIDEIYPELGANDYATFLTKIAEEKPDVVYSFMAGSDAISFVKQYDSFGLKGKIPFAGSLEYGDILVTRPTGASSEGIISGMVYSPWLENDVNKAFVKAYQDKYNKLPDIFSVEGYDAAQVIDKAISKAGNVKSMDLAKALKGISIDSPRGPLTIDPKTHNPIENFYIEKNVMKDGQIVPGIIKEIDNVTMPEKSPF